MLAVLTIAAEMRWRLVDMLGSCRGDKGGQEGEGLEDCHVYDPWDFFL